MGDDGDHLRARNELTILDKSFLLPCEVLDEPALPQAQ